MNSLTSRLVSGMTSIAALPAEQATVQQLLFNSIRLNRPEFNRFWANDEVRFLSYVFAMRERSRSQILQDLWVCFELHEKRHGFFVEFGATDGLTNSNTWLLENEFGWGGILAEPNPHWHGRLMGNRRVPIEHRCVSSASDEHVRFLTTDDSDPEISGLAAFADGDHFAQARERGNAIEVETISLDDLLDKYNAPAEMDYLSIDTEGSELEILSAFHFDRHHFRLMSVEQNTRTAAGLERLLEQHGYLRIFPQFSQWDGWYVSEELVHAPRPQIMAPRA